MATGYNYTPVYLKQSVLGAQGPQQPAQQAGMQDPTGRPANPWDDRLQQQLARMDAMKDIPPMYTPEEVSKRRSDNERDYQLGMLGSMSGIEQLQGVGGSVLKQAMAAREPKITEKGVADPITGEFRYDPDYLRSQEASRLDALMKLKNAADLDINSHQREQDFRREMQGRHEQLALALHAGRGGGGGGGGGGADEFGGSAPPISQDADGRPIFRTTKTGRLFQYDENGQPVAYHGPVDPKASNAAPSEGERKAASLLQRLTFSQGQLEKALQEHPEAATGTVLTQSVGHAPWVGDYLATKTQSPARQRIENAQLDILDAALTLGTGAAYTREQLKGYAKSYFAQPGEKDPQVLQDKKDRLNNVIASAKIAAGRSGPGGGKGGGGGNNADPLGIGGGGGGGGQPAPAAAPPGPPRPVVLTDTARNNVDPLGMFTRR